MVVNRVTGWPDSYFYDIDLALAVIREPTRHDPALIAYSPHAFSPQSRHILQNPDETELIEVDHDEAEGLFACNLISTGTDVVMSAAAVKLQADLERAGLRTHTPHVRELAKGGGFIRCTTLTIT